MSILVLPAVFVLCCFVPGWTLGRRLAWPSAERLCAALVGSALALYLLTFGAFLLGWPRGWAAIVPLGALAWVAWDRRVLREFVGLDETKRLLLGWIAVLLGGLLVLCVSTTYAGADWMGDWLEHFQRARYYLEGSGESTRFLDHYDVAERPPLMNLLAAMFMDLAGKSHARYQLVALMLNSLVFFAAAALARSFGAERNAWPAILVVVVLCNPMFVHNLTYGWTRSLCSFFVLSGVVLYLRTLRETDGHALTLAFVSLGLAVATHYSALPYLVFVLAHCLVSYALARPRRPITLLAVASPLAILLPWVAWNVAQAGSRTVVQANIFARVAGELSIGELALRSAANLRDTIVPHFLRSVNLRWFDHGSWLGYLHDFTFALYQTNLLFALGSMGFGLLGFELLRRSAVTAREKVFWIGLVVSAVVLGTISHPRTSPFGAAHIAMQPIVMLGLVGLSAAWGRWPPAVRWIAGIGWAVDLLLGVALHVGQQIVRVHAARFDDGRWEFDTSQSVSWATYQNLILQARHDIVFLGERLAPYRVVGIGAAALVLVAVGFGLQRARRSSADGNG